MTIQSGPLTWIFLALLALGDVVLLRIFLASGFEPGKRSWTAAWLFLTGAGVGGIVAGAVAGGRHPAIDIVVAAVCGAGLGALGWKSGKRDDVHDARSGMHARSA